MLLLHIHSITSLQAESSSTTEAPKVKIKREAIAIGIENPLAEIAVAKNAPVTAAPIPSPHHNLGK